MSKQELSTKEQPIVDTLPIGLLEELRQVIDQTRQFIATTVNAALTMAFWKVGNRIRKESLQGDRAEIYGREIVVTLSRQLVSEYGNSFSDKNLRRMIQFSELFPDEQIVVSLIRQLTWTHFIALIPIKDALKRDFYAEMCRVQHWNVRTLRKQIGSMLFERTALSKKPESLVEAEIEMLRKKVRWNSIYAGSTNTNVALEKSLQLGSSYVQESNKKALNYWNWTNQAFMSLNTSRRCLPKKSFSENSIKRSSVHG